METWKDVLGYEGIYQVSDEGRVRRLDRVIKRNHQGSYVLKGKIMIQCLAHSGYLMVGLKKEGKRNGKLVHRLVYEAFHGKIPEGLVVNHIDEIKTNNRLDNLNLMTQKENCNWGAARERLSASQRNNQSKSKQVYGYDKDGNIVVSFPSINEADRNGYNSGAVCNACKNKFNKIGNNKYKGLYWKYGKMGDC